MARAPRSAPRIAAPILACTLALLAGGCAETCDAEGTGGLNGFDLDCDELSFLLAPAATHLTLAEIVDGAIDLELEPVNTLGKGLRFEHGGEYDLAGSYSAEGVSIAPVDGGWLEITRWESVDDEDYGQRVDLEFHVEVGATNTFVGGEVDGEAFGVPAYASG